MANIFLQTLLVATLFGVISANFLEIGSYGVGQSHEKKYFHKKEHSSWYNAQLQCEQNGMEPLRIDSKDEENNFFDLIHQNSNIKIGIWHHIGGLRIDNQWKWKSDFSDVFATKTWTSGEPNNAFDGENCLAIYKAHHKVNIGFSDIRCENHLLGFFCQRTKNSKASQSCVDVNANEQVEGKSAKELDLERQLESQMGVCKLLSEALNTMLITGKDVSVDATDSNNARKYKTVTVSVTSNEYEY